jgi:Ca-activated chloride channel family protein
MKSLVTSIFIALLALQMNAQTPVATPTPPPDGDEVIKVDSRLVVVPVAVFDTDGKPVTALTAKDFRLKEGGRPQELTQVTDAEKVPLEIAILLDISASTGSMFQYQKETAARFLQEVMNVGDKATIITIGNRPSMVASHVDAEAAGEALRSIEPTKERTAFFDGVGAAADFLMKNSSEATRRVVLVISDGDDTNSSGVLRAIFEAEGRLVRGNTTEEELRKLRYAARESAKLGEQRKVSRVLQDADAVFFSINTLGAALQLNQSAAFGQSNLERFATDTGGSFFIPKFEPTNLKDKIQNEYNERKNRDTLSAIFRQLTVELRSQYLIQYYSDGDHPAGKFVDLKIELTEGTGRKIRSRKGYFAK